MTIFVSIDPYIPTSFLCYFLGAYHIFLGKTWAEGKGVFASSRRCADRGQELDCK